MKDKIVETKHADNLFVVCQYNTCTICMCSVWIKAGIPRGGKCVSVSEGLDADFLSQSCA